MEGGGPGTSAMRVSFLDDFKKVFFKKHWPKKKMFIKIGQSCKKICVDIYYVWINVKYDGLSLQFYIIQSLTLTPPNTTKSYTEYSLFHPAWKFFVEKMDPGRAWNKQGQGAILLPLNQEMPLVLVDFASPGATFMFEITPGYPAKLHFCWHISADLPLNCSRLVEEKLSLVLK